jgi:16S rRNA (guanine527-N7)-methyltransferase
MSIGRAIDPGLTAALAAAQIELPPERIEALGRYAALLWDWNKRMNLTRHTTWELFVGRDLRDVLALAPLLAPAERVLDVGSGGGVPGLPLAILRSDLQISLCETLGRKAQALRAFVAGLGLDVEVLPARAEGVLKTRAFDAVTMRAVTSIAKACALVEPYWNAVGRLLLIKGPRWIAERAEAEAAGALRHVRLRVAATYPLGGEDYGEGVILELAGSRPDPPGRVASK